MKTRLALALALIACPLYAATLTAPQVHAIAKVMMDGYWYGGVGLMRTKEDDCWNDMIARPNRAERDDLAVACMVSAMTGALIEATAARAESRGPLPIYTGDAVRERSLKATAKAGYSKAEAQAMIEEAAGHAKAAIEGLMMAGAR